MLIFDDFWRNYWTEGDVFSRVTAKMVKLWLTGLQQLIASN